MIFPWLISRRFTVQWVPHGKALERIADDQFATDNSAREGQARGGPALPRATFNDNSGHLRRQFQQFERHHERSLIASPRRNAVLVANDANSQRNSLRP